MRAASTATVRDPASSLPRPPGVEFPEGQRFLLRVHDDGRRDGHGGLGPAEIEPVVIPFTVRGNASATVSAAPERFMHVHDGPGSAGRTSSGRAPARRGRRQRPGEGTGLQRDRRVPGQPTGPPRPDGVARLPAFSVGRAGRDPRSSGGRRRRSLSAEASGRPDGSAGPHPHRLGPVLDTGRAHCPARRLRRVDSGLRNRR